MFEEMIISAQEVIINAKPYLLFFCLIFLFAITIFVYFLEESKRVIKEKVKKDLELSFSQKLLYRDLFTDKDKELLLKEKEIQLLKTLLQERMTHEERTEEK
jgi:hypothetical protein